MRTDETTLIELAKIAKELDLVISAMDNQLLDGEALIQRIGPLAEELDRFPENANASRCAALLRQTQQQSRVGARTPARAFLGEARLTINGGGTRSYAPVN